MPNNVTGYTDISGAVSVMPASAKTVCVIGVPGVGGTAVANTPFSIVSESDAATKWGTGSICPDLVAVLIKNGVTDIKGIVTTAVGNPPTLSTVYTTALAALITQKVDIIITDSLDASVHALIKTHLEACEDDDIFRYACVGIAGTSDNTALASAAAAINSRRMFMPGPSVVDASGTTLDGCYAAAAIAAIIAVECLAKDPALPANSVEILGFGGISRVLSKTERATLVGDGVVPLYTAASGNPAVFRLVTTYTLDELSAPDTTWQEGTTSFIADDVLGACITRIKTNYKRTKNIARILDAIRTDIIDVLQKKNDLEIIENFDAKSVTVIRDPADLYGALIEYSFDVVTPLYNITIKQKMKL